MPRQGKAGPRQPLSRTRPGKSHPKVGTSRTGTTPQAGRPKRRGATAVPASRPKGSTARPRSIPAKQAHAAEVYRRLMDTYPDAHCELDHGTPWQLLVATILSAQCTDRRVNMVTPVLFEAFPTPAALAAAPQAAIEEIIRSTGFFRNKARNIIAMSGAIVDQHDGSVPDDMEALVTLPGVGRKTANVVLGNAFHVNVGVVVDTHVQRVARRLGLTAHTDPVKVEQDLMALFERDTWTVLAHLLIWHGRQLCHARKPLCGQCPLADICPSATIG